MVLVAAFAAEDSGSACLAIRNEYIEKRNI